jgi:hypothetical protein
MASKYNLEEIESRYRMYYEEARIRGRESLPYYEVQPWDIVLNDVEKRIFQDIREIGIPLYPIFPVAEKTYLHFANPFTRIGIEIAYKNSPRIIIDRKLGLLKSQNWTTFVISSKNCYYTLDEFFLTKRKDPNICWDDLDYDLKCKFFDKYHLENSVCLLNHINEYFFREHVV